MMREAPGHKIMFWSFYVKDTRAEALTASITCIPTVSFTAKVPKIINISIIAISMKGQRFPATAGSIQAFDETCYRLSLSGDGHNGDLNVTGICERRLIWGCCPSARETIRGQWVCNIFKLGFISHCPPLLGFGPHMRTVSICPKCETFAIMDCGRFYRLSFTVALRGRGSASHLLTVTVPATSIMGCLSVTVNSLMDIVASTVKIISWASS